MPIASSTCGSAKPAHESVNTSAQSRRVNGTRARGERRWPSRANTNRSGMPTSWRAATIVHGGRPASASFVRIGASAPQVCVTSTANSTASGHPRELIDPRDGVVSAR